MENNIIFVNNKNVFKISARDQRKMESIIKRKLRELGEIQKQKEEEVHKKIKEDQERALLIEKRKAEEMLEAEKKQEEAITGYMCKLAELRCKKYLENYRPLLPYLAREFIDNKAEEKMILAIKNYIVDSLAVDKIKTDVSNLLKQYTKEPPKNGSEVHYSYSSDISDEEMVEYVQVIYGLDITIQHKEDRNWDDWLVHMRIINIIKK